MKTTTIAQAAPTALLVGTRGEQRALSSLVSGLGFEPVHAENGDAVPQIAELSLCLIDLQANGDALRAARVIRARHPKTIIIGIADPARPTASAEAIRAGVFDVLPRPAAARDLETLLANAREQSSLTRPTRTAVVEASSWGLVGTSPAMRAVMDLVQRAAAGRSGILLCGERGTGREMIARAIHDLGPQRSAGFIKVDCAGPSPDALERDLFGNLNKRAGTGLPERRSLERVSRDSRLCDANGGILFLENVTEMPARLQARLTRILRDGEVFADDERQPLTLDVRAIASVDVTIDLALDEGRLRADLYERLSVLRVDLPPLRMRREDIPVLATHFLKDICRRSGQPIKSLTRAALTLLSALAWRGNAPELRALLERLVLAVPNGLIRLEDVLAHTQLEGSISPTGHDATLKQARARFERDYIAAVLQQQHGRIAEAAKLLGIQRTNLYRKMRTLNLVRGGKSVKGDA